MTPDKGPHRTIIPVYFVHINKTGGRSIKTLLRLDYRHFTARQKIAEIGREAWDDAFTFSVVRNPFDRCVSLWAWRKDRSQHPMHTDKPFHIWVVDVFGGKAPEYIDAPQPMEKDGRFMPQIDWITDENGDICVDAVFRFEDLPEMFPGLPHTNKTNRGDWRGYYRSRESIDVVRHFFRDDFERWYRREWR